VQERNIITKHMEKKVFSPLHVYKEFKPHLIMVLAQVGYTFLYFISEASFNHGMSPFVYVTYRHVVAGVVMFPFAYFLERYMHISLQNASKFIVCVWPSASKSCFCCFSCRSVRPKLTIVLFMEIFVLSLLG